MKKIDKTIKEKVQSATSSYIFEHTLEPALDNSIRVAKIDQHEFIAYHLGGRAGHIFVMLDFNPDYDIKGGGVCTTARLLYKSVVANKMTDNLISLFD